MVVGLVGCGNWGRHILRDLIALGCEVPVVARSAESKARAREGGASAIVDEIASLPRLDGAVVATATSSHAEVLDELLGLGVPCFCEKPLTNDRGEARRLAELAPERLFVMDKWRYHPGIAELAAIAREGRLGTVAGLSTRRLGWGSIHDDVDAVWVLAPHDLAISLEIFGSLGRPEAAGAQWLGGGAEHLAGLLSGAGWWHALEVSARSPERKRAVELHCEGGVAVLDDGWADYVTVYLDGTDGAEEQRIETPGELPLLAELRAFVEHLDGGPPPRSSAAEAAEIVSVVAELRQLAGEH
jgi:predicted dehydrogenase